LKTNIPKDLKFKEWAKYFKQGKQHW
jgi:hypothetical protein